MSTNIWFRIQGPQQRITDSEISTSELTICQSFSLFKDTDSRSALTIVWLSERTRSEFSVLTRINRFSVFVPLIENRWEIKENNSILVEMFDNLQHRSYFSAVVHFPISKSMFDRRTFSKRRKTCLNPEKVSNRFLYCSGANVINLAIFDSVYYEPLNCDWSKFDVQQIFDTVTKRTSITRKIVEQF